MPGVTEQPIIGLAINPFTIPAGKAILIMYRILRTSIRPIPVHRGVPDRTRAVTLDS